MGSATSGPTIQRRRQHLLVNETPALEGGMWVPKSPCLVYHHRMDDGVGGFQRGAFAPTWPEAAMHAQLCVSAIHSPQQQTKGLLVPEGNSGSIPQSP